MWGDMALVMPAVEARFTPDGTMIVAAGQAGISLLRVADGALIATAEVTAAMLRADTLRPARMPVWIKQKMGLEGI